MKRLRHFLSYRNIVRENRLPSYLIWLNIKSFGLDVLVWWENIVKPGLKKLAQTRSREISKQVKGELNLFRLRQIYLNRKLSLGELFPHYR